MRKNGHEQPALVTGTTSFDAAIRGDHLDQHSTAVQDLTGRPPCTVAEVLTSAS